MMIGKQNRKEGCTIVISGKVNVHSLYEIWACPYKELQNCKVLREPGNKLTYLGFSRLFFQKLRAPSLADSLNFKRKSEKWTEFVINGQKMKSIAFFLLCTCLPAAVILIRIK
jgi:hypothetical protein